MWKLKNLPPKNSKITDQIKLHFLTQRSEVVQKVRFSSTSEVIFKVKLPQEGLVVFSLLIRGLLSESYERLQEKPMFLDDEKFFLSYVKVAQFAWQP